MNLEKQELVFNNPKYVYLNTNFLKLDLDMKEESISTLLYHLEKDFIDEDGPLITFHQSFFQNVHLWFFTKTPEDCSLQNNIMKVALDNAYHSNGVYRISIPLVAKKLNINPTEMLPVLQDM